MIKAMPFKMYKEAYNRATLTSTYAGGTSLFVQTTRAKRADTNSQVVIGGVLLCEIIFN